MDVISTLIRFLKKYIKPEDIIHNDWSLLPLIKNVLLFVINSHFYDSNYHIWTAMDMLNYLFNLFSVSDNGFSIYFIEYFICNMLGDCVYIISNKVEDKIICWVIGIVDTVLIKIIKLDSPIRQELLFRFKKWFITNTKFYVTEYLTERKDFEDEEHRPPRGMESFDFPVWYFTEEVLFDIFFEFIPWFINRSNGIDFLAFYICEGFYFFKYDIKRPHYFLEYKRCLNNKKISFLNNVKLQISKKLVDDMCWTEEDKMIIPSWYNKLLYMIELALNEKISEKEEYIDLIGERDEHIDEEVKFEDIYKGIEELVRLYMGK